MRVHLIKKQTIEDFCKLHPNSKNSFSEWLEKIKYAQWDKAKDILHTFRSADLLGKDSNRVIFNIGGNKYRLICKYLFGDFEIHLFVCWIGSHSEYTKLCLSFRQFTINDY